MYTPDLYPFRNRLYLCGSERYDMRRTRVKCGDERGKPIKSMPMSVIGMFRQLTIQFAGNLLMTKVPSGLSSAQPWNYRVVANPIDNSDLMAFQWHGTHGSFL